MIALEAAGNPAPAATLWLDDSTRNITAGHRLGMCCVLVGRTGVDTPADYQIERLTDLHGALPWLWEQQQQSEQQEHETQEQVVQQQGLGKPEPLALVSSPRGKAITAFSV